MPSRSANSRSDRARPAASSSNHARPRAIALISVGSHLDRSFCNATAGSTSLIANLSPAMAETKPVSQVVQWNRTLLSIVRTAGAQPVTIHPTRSFAITHAAIYDAVNAIDGTHRPYLIRLVASRSASQEAAAAAAAHEVLVKLYPTFQATLDAQFQQALAHLPTTGRADGASIG